MKRSFPVLFAVCCFPLAVLAQPQHPMNGQPGTTGPGTTHPGTMSPEEMHRQGNEMTHEQIMSQETMRGVSHLMIRMQDMIHSTAHAMDQMHSIDQDRRQELSTIMAQLSDQLQALSGDMKRGTVSPDRLHQMDKDMDRINNMINDVQKPQK